MKTRFQNPPINEVAISIHFSPPLSALRNEHVGLFWSKIRDRFPTVEQREPTGGVSAFSMTSGDVFPMPRFWFISEDQASLIQIQKDTFIFNWRRSDTAYPHFDEHIKPAFDKYYRVFEEFVRTDAGVQEFGIDRRTLTYHNMIEPCDYWEGRQDTVKVIPSFAVPGCGHVCNDGTAFNCRYLYRLASDLHLGVTLRSVDPPSGKLPVLVFEISAFGCPGEAGESAADLWDERAHDAIISCFMSMTSKEIQRAYWKPVRPE